MSTSQPTPHGFKWGGVEVSRTCEMPCGQNGHKIIMVKGKREWAEIRVTPGGFVRVRLFRRKGNVLEEKG